MNSRNELFDDVGSTATNIANGFTVVAVGDVQARRPVTNGHHPGFEAVVDVLRDADITFGNLETSIFDLRGFTGSPQAECGGGYHASPPELGPDLKAMGFNLMGRANNHSLDWGVEGMRETGRVLDQNDIVHAGVGETLAQAGAARFRETARGRVGLVSFASTFTPLSPAADAAGEAPGRPGLQALRLTKSVVILPDMLENIRQIRNALPEPTLGPEHEDRVVLGDVTYMAGKTVGYDFEPDPRDVREILRNVRQGKQFSDFMIVTNHSHEPGNWSQEPPNYAQSLAHQVIDAGADAYVVIGHHQLQGIEVYNGRPIFYGLGDFIFDNLQAALAADYFAEYDMDPRVDTVAEVLVDSMKGFVDPLFYESVVTVSRFEQNELAELRLLPIELGYSERLADRGTPRLAPPKQAQAILERLQRLSKPFGTRISIEDGVGVIRAGRA